MPQTPMQDHAGELFERERERFEDVKGFLDANGEASVCGRRSPNWQAGKPNLQKVGHHQKK